MKTIIVIFFALTVVGCRTIYVPQETIRTKYVDRVQHDSVYLHDSVFVKVKNDTVWLEKYRYVYRDKVVHDSIIERDSIPYPVYVDVPVKYVPQVYKWGLWIALLAIGGVLLKIILKFKR